MKKLIIILSLLLILTGCTQSTSNNTDDQNNSSTDGGNEQVDFTIEMSNMKFSPNLIEVEAGQTIKVKITSQDMPHDFVIDELDIQSPLVSAGGSKIFEITIPDDLESGDEFEFYCSVSNHKALGMVGTLRIK